MTKDKLPSVAAFIADVGLAIGAGVLTAAADADPDKMMGVLVDPQFS